MRKFSSIVLLLILLFNMVGYRAWFYYAELKADAAMENRLDNDQYNENELISLSIPLYIPYLSEQDRFERINGEISYQGKTYRFVKRKVSGGNIILLCIPDTRKMVLKKAKTDFGNAVNDLTGNGKNSSRSGLQKNFSDSDCICQWTTVHIVRLTNESAGYNAYHGFGFPDPHIDIPGKPPQSWA